MSGPVPMRFLVRFATPADAEAICRVHVASIRESCAGDYTPQQIEAWAGPKRPEDYIRDGSRRAALGCGGRGDRHRRLRRSTAMS